MEKLINRISSQNFAAFVICFTYWASRSKVSWSSVIEMEVGGKLTRKWKGKQWGLAIQLLLSKYIHDGDNFKCGKFEFCINIPNDTSWAIALER